MLSYGYKNTVGAVAHLFFSDPPLTPHAIGMMIDMQIVFAFMFIFVLDAVPV